MNAVHTAVIGTIRTAAQDMPKLHASLQTLSDAQMMRLMFVSYRGTGPRARGLRLTQAGVEMMIPFFRHVEVTLPQGRQIQAGELIYLDRRATLPYYCANARLVVFETELGMKLRLWGGDIAAIAEIESY